MLLYALWTTYNRNTTDKDNNDGDDDVTINLNGTIINKVSEVKFLGVTIDLI